MEVPFAKLAGSGNDFVIVDNRSLRYSFAPEQIRLICDRKTGIGADGLILAEPGEKCSVKMRIYNSDGYEAEMCGNGLRCLARFLNEKGIKTPDIESKMGIHSQEVLLEGVRVSMTDPKNMRLQVELKKGLTVDYLDTGVPHAVLEVTDLDNIDINILGPYIRHHEAFNPRGANANFVKIIDSQTLEIRTFERGVEGETLACGTGATAAAILMSYRYNWKAPIIVIPKSKERLIINFEWLSGEARKVTQTGPVKSIFHGSFHLKDLYASENKR